MKQLTISAQVVNGQLLLEQSLAPLEGQHVVGTLTVVPQESSAGKATDMGDKAQTSPTPAPAVDDDFDPEPPEWLDIENDVYFPMSRPEEILGIKKIIVERGEPCIILPEELPDERLSLVRLGRWRHHAARGYPGELSLRAT